jgi:hypothetical protein
VIGEKRISTLRGGKLVLVIQKKVIGEMTEMCQNFCTEIGFEKDAIVHTHAAPTAPAALVRAAAL